MRSQYRKVSDRFDHELLPSSEEDDLQTTNSEDVRNERSSSSASTSSHHTHTRQAVNMPMPEENEARLFFFAGFLGLPLLWLFSALYQYNKYGSKNVNIWARMSLIGSVCFLFLLCVWVAFFQITWRGLAHRAVGFMLNVPQPDQSMW